MNAPPTNASAPPIGWGRLLAITCAFIAPATSLFLTFGPVYRLAGPDVVLAYALGGAVSVLMMLCYAEVGSVHPEAGGDYALAARTLGPRAGAVVGAAFVFKGMALPALLCLGAAAYVHVAVPGLPMLATAAGLLALVLVLAPLDLRTSSGVVLGLVGLELLVLVVFAAVAGSAVPTAPVVVPPARGVGWLGVMGAVGPVLYAMNGPQACLYFSEEVVGSGRQLGRTILGVSVLTVAIQVGGAALGTLALASMGPLSHGAVPLMALPTHAGWTRTALAWLPVGIGAALFDAALTTTMGYGRIYRALARDHLWPAPLNDWLAAGGRVAPYLLLGVGNGGLLLVARLRDLVAPMGALVMLVYVAVAIAALVSRLGRRGIPFRMPAWPLPPLLALGVLGILVRFLPSRQLVALLGVLVLGAAWGYPRPE